MILISLLKVFVWGIIILGVIIGLFLVLIDVVLLIFLVKNMVEGNKIDVIENLCWIFVVLYGLRR